MTGQSRVCRTTPGFTAKPDASGNVWFDGLNVAIRGSANNKDRFIVKPVNDVIVDVTLRSATNPNWRWPPARKRRKRQYQWPEASGFTER
ncbi:hypothetical protein ACVXG7_02345 [Enterobacter hormaechei]